jgi:ABC-type multidrug transport system ATPase subunit
MRQKLAIVRTLVHDPKVIFLDEPTSGLDPESARTVRDAVAELATEGRTIVLCSHNLAEVERLCTRAAIIQGRLLAMAPLNELRRAGQALDIRVEGDAERFRPVLAALPFAPNVLSEGGSEHGVPAEARAGGLLEGLPGPAQERGAAAVHDGAAPGVHLRAHWRGVDVRAAAG